MTSGHGHGALSDTYHDLLMSDIIYRKYMGEPDLPHIMELVQSELSEPYVIYTFRYFLHYWYVHSFGSHDYFTSIDTELHRRLGHIYLSLYVSPYDSKMLGSLRGSSPAQAYSDNPNESVPIGVIVCKQSTHKGSINRGYIAMLSVSKNWRKRGIGSSPLPPSFPSSHKVLD